jgi:hypothetical protein
VWPGDMAGNSHALYSAEEQTEMAKSFFIFVSSSNPGGCATTMPKHGTTNCTTWPLIFDVAKPRMWWRGLKEKQRRRWARDGA